MPKHVSGQLHPTRVANLFLFSIRPIDSNIEEQYIIFKLFMLVINADFFNLNALSLYTEMAVLGRWSNFVQEIPTVYIYIYRFMI
jgi:hypothetical protein